MSSLDFQSVHQNATSSLVKATKLVGQLVAEDLPYQIALDPTLSQAIEQQNARILALTRRILDSAVSGGSVRSPSLRDADDVDNNWRGIVEVVDSMLEKADTCLDEYTGMIKRGGSVQVEPPRTKKKKYPWQLDAKFRTNVNMDRPQASFDTKPDNWATTPFVPLLKTKPHAIVPLSDSLQHFSNEHGKLEYKNPYEPEINHLTFPDFVSKTADLREFSALDSSKAIYVDTVEALESMVIELRSATEIAVDLEHHDELSYVGITCLMQISTRDKDWIVDTLKPWRAQLQILNDVFADPKIVKVFHGAYMDIVWLQRDFGIYVVGLFDTFHACRALGYPQASLGYLLERFVGFEADKQYQMADWRIRPLPSEMLYYAQSDTHFLLDIYDRIRNELIERAEGYSTENNRLEDVLLASKETSSQRYQRFIYDGETGSGPAGWLPMLAKLSGSLDKEQLAVFKRLHQWRDSVARELDESIHRIMPKQALLQVSRIMPTDKSAMQSLVKSASHGVISQAVLDRISDLVMLLQKAKQDSVDDPKDGAFMTSPPGGVQPASAGAPSFDIMASHESDGSKTLPLVPIELSEGSRADLSQFWGQSFGSSLWSVHEAPVLDDSLRLALPMPPLTAEIFQSPAKQAVEHASTSAIDPGARAEHAYVKDREARVKDNDNGVFIIKEMGGRKRKSRKPEVGQNSAVAESSTDLIGPEEDDGQDDAKNIASQEQLETETRRARKKRRAERKASKRQNGKPNSSTSGLEAADTNGKHSQPQNLPEEKAFDYANAKSILHAKVQSSDGRKGKKEFNPYSKSTDAPKGMRRVKKEQPGKSATFKS